MIQKDILLATKNKHKIEEISLMLSPFHFNIQRFADVEREPEIEETGKTFVENAYLKASAVFARYGKPVLADDSGLIVPSLKNKPGIYSSRFAGPRATDEENNEKLIQELAGKRTDERRAYFECVILYYQKRGDIETVITAAGEVHGVIADTCRGNKGFGYDPLFIPDGHEKTFAQLGPEIKNQLSHRKRALDRWIEKFHLQA